LKLLLKLKELFDFHFFFDLQNVCKMLKTGKYLPVQLKVMLYNNSNYFFG